MSNCVRAVSRLCLSCAQVCKSCWQLVAGQEPCSECSLLAGSESHPRPAPWQGLQGMEPQGRDLGSHCSLFCGAVRRSNIPCNLALDLCSKSGHATLEAGVGDCEATHLKCHSKHCNTNVGCISKVLDKALALGKTLDEFPSQAVNSRVFWACLY